VRAVGERSERVFVSDRGNVFMREIAEHLVEALAGRGHRAELVVGELPDGGDPMSNLVVAPHELFVLAGAGDADLERAARRCVCVNTEQHGTPFFDLAMRWAALGPVVLDINPSTLAAIRRRGLAAVHLPLGYVPSMDRWHGRTTARDVDLAFLGGRTERRERFVGGAGGVLWEWRTDLRFFSWHRPATAEHPAFSSGDAKYRALAGTRILLNVHRGEDPYFEWARVIEAVANGCAVATETSTGIEPFVAGEHLLMAPLEDLAERAVALALDEPRRAEMARAAYEVLRGRLDQGALLERSLEAARAAAVARGERGERARRAGALAATVRSRAAGLVPRRAPDAVAPATAERQMLDHTARQLKQAYLDQIEEVRGIERALATLRHGDPDHVEVRTTAAWGAAAPGVSVVVPLFDQGRYLADAVGSVVAASAAAGREVELVVVDDHSTDHSLAVATSLLRDLAWFPMAVVARAANGGLPVARNTGFAHARAPYVFALDADNVLYPSGLGVLAAHLDEAPAEVVAAYGLLERFDERGAVGLTSHLPWDVELLVQGAYIDAMAMLRRSAWEQLGGYASSSAIYGWEDYDLWLATAERGWRADLVTRVVGRYREQPGSMRRISDIDMATNFVVLRERHPRLPWPS